MHPRPDRPAKPDGDEQLLDGISRDWRLGLLLQPVANVAQDLLPVVSVTEDGGRNRTDLVAKDGVESVDNVDLPGSQAAAA